MLYCVDNQVEEANLTYPPHSADELGFPMNPDCCQACAARNKAMNDRYLEDTCGWPTAWTNPAKPETYEEDWSKR